MKFPLHFVHSKPKAPGSNFLGADKEIFGIGLMSGTSADGIDVALIRIQRGIPGSRELIHFKTYPYPEELTRLIHSIAAPNGGNVEDVCFLNFLLAEFWADAVLAFLAEASVPRSKISYIASHGQTVCHLPEPTTFLNKSVASTLQIGEAAVLANRTGLVTVSDFRVADVAVGGQGAPLVPFFDQLVFRDPQVNRILLNIGGIANVTILPAEANTKVIAFDTGPGNCLLDELARRYCGLPFDVDGDCAARGSCQPDLLAFLMKDPYLRKAPPKSTGREYYLGAFLDRFMETVRKKQPSKEDLLATVTHFVASSIRESCLPYLKEFSGAWEMIVSGGGRKNRFLLDLLRQQLEGFAFRDIEDFGIPSDAKEAVAFAVLGYCCLKGLPANLPEITGASHATILGKISLPPPSLPEGIR